jgi:CheY-like chemotaxis protein
VVLAESGEEALRLLQVQPVDCILLDVVMPGMGGVEVARHVRSMPQLANTPVVMLTASYQGKVMAEALAVGVDAFCLKTEDFGLLRAQVRNELRRRVQAEAQAPEAPRAVSASGGTPGGGLFEALVGCCGLSQVIASSTMSRACRRAGVEAQELTAANLAQVLPSIRETLRVFLSPEQLETRMQAISALANTERVQHIG